METRVIRYGTKFWAVYLEGELVAVTVYRKGAERVAAVIRCLHEFAAAPESFDSEPGTKKIAEER
jgi:hypothetical protein